MSDRILDGLMSGKLIPALFALVGILLLIVIVIANLAGAKLDAATFDLITTIIKISLGGGVVGSASVFASQKTIEARAMPLPERPLSQYQVFRPDFHDTKPFTLRESWPLGPPQSVPEPSVGTEGGSSKPVIPPQPPDPKTQARLYQWWLAMWKRLHLSPQPPTGQPVKPK